jgi:hypothetical protein
VCIPDGVIDLVTLTHVYEHLRGPDVVLLNLARILGPVVICISRFRMVRDGRPAGLGRHGFIWTRPVIWLLSLRKLLFVHCPIWDLNSFVSRTSTGAESLRMAAECPESVAGETRLTV